MKKNKNNSARTDITVLPIVPGTVILSALMLLAFLIHLMIKYRNPPKPKKGDSADEK